MMQRKSQHPASPLLGGYQTRSRPRIRGTHLPFSFLRYCGLSLW